MKRILALFLIVFMLFSTSLITGCQKDDANNDTTQTQELTKEDKVRNAVRVRILSYSLIAKIGGNEIRSATQTITNIKWLSESECLVSGIAYMTDIYSTRYKNNFDCRVTTSDNGETWSARSLEFKSNYWSKT